MCGLVAVNQKGDWLKNQPPDWEAATAAYWILDIGYWILDIGY
jgi:hypothetical protein